VVTTEAAREPRAGGGAAGWLAHLLRQPFGELMSAVYADTRIAAPKPRLGKLMASIEGLEASIASGLDGH
jgi:hypothetical protein